MRYSVLFFTFYCARIIRTAKYFRSMKKDIPNLKVEDLAIAVVPRNGEELWDTYILNLRDDRISDVLINSHGYGKINGSDYKTTTLRHFFEEIGPLQIKQIEPIQTKLFQLTNEYWVSFRYDGYMYDKKYVLVKGSIDQIHFTPIPFLDRRGVMIR